MGKYVGESEHNLIEAIRTAEAAQPCVLWIDEIEKAFAGFGNSDQNNDITITRMVGYFLTWMQERKALFILLLQRMICPVLDLNFWERGDGMKYSICPILTQKEQMRYSENAWKNTVYI